MTQKDKILKIRAIARQPNKKITDKHNCEAYYTSLIAEGDNTRVNTMIFIGAYDKVYPDGVLQLTEAFEIPINKKTGQYYGHYLTNNTIKADVEIIKGEKYTNYKLSNIRPYKIDI